MRSRFKLVLACLLSAGAAAHFAVAAQRPPMMVLESSVETAAGLLSLPASDSGLVVVRACSACAAQTFRLDRKRVLWLDGQSVSLREMSAALAGSRNSPVTLHYRLSDSLITRVVCVLDKP